MHSVFKLMQCNEWPHMLTWLWYGCTKWIVTQHYVEYCCIDAIYILPWYTKLSENDTDPSSLRHRLSRSHGCCIAPWYSHYFWRTLWMQNIYSVVDVLYQNPHWWSPVIFLCMELISIEGCLIKYCSNCCVHCRTIALIQSHVVLTTILFSTAGDGELVWKMTVRRWSSYQVSFP